jgi:hypothetical protein
MDLQLEYLLNFSHHYLIGGYVLRIATAFFAFLAPLCLFSAEGSPDVKTTSIQNGPAIESYFFPANAIHDLPKLKQFEAEDPGFNKVVFKLKGFPTRQPIVLELKVLTVKNDAYHTLMTFMIQDDGSYLMANQRTQKYVVTSSKGFLPGERVYYRFRTADGSVSKEVSGIPNPAEFRDKECNVALRAEILSVDPTVYAIDLPTMAEGEEYNLKTVSMGAIVTGKPKYSSKAPFHFSPGGKGKGGISTLEVRRKNGDLYFLKLPWGTALEPYRHGQEPKVK